MIFKGRILVILSARNLTATQPLMEEPMDEQNSINQAKIFGSITVGTSNLADHGLSVR